MGAYQENCRILVSTFSHLGAQAELTKKAQHFYLLAKLKTTPRANKQYHGKTIACEVNLSDHTFDHGWPCTSPS